VFLQNRSTAEHIFCSQSDAEEKWEYKRQYISYLQIVRKHVDSVGREVLYSIIIEFEVLMKLVRLTKMCSASDLF
jgi:hypothetical protein